MGRHTPRAVKACMSSSLVRKNCSMSRARRSSSAIGSRGGNTPAMARLISMVSGPLGITRTLPVEAGRSGSRASGVPARKEMTWAPCISSQAPIAE